MKIYDLEQDIMECWKVVDDIELTTKWFVDDPTWEGIDPVVASALMNKYFAIQELYELKFSKLWDDFEQVTKDYHIYKKLALNEREPFDD